MTFRQQKAIEKAKEKIEEIRNLLDEVMYYSDPLGDKEFNKVREAYKNICAANDELP